MTERAQLLSSLATTIADYRAGELQTPTPDHVDRWVRQFADEAQQPILRELDHVLKKTYFTRRFVQEFIDELVRTEELAGSDPCEFWRGAGLLEIQKNGQSQAEMLELLGDSLLKHCGLARTACTGGSGQYVYLDDVLFSGSRIGNDLTTWISGDAPQEAKVHIIVIAAHKLGQWQCIERLRKEAEKVGKKIDFEFWRAISFENRKKYRAASEVLWPASLPDDDQLKAYMAMEEKFPFELRRPAAWPASTVFSSEQGRQTLERELLLAGVKIRGFSQNPSRWVRPLGFSAYGLGFGSPVVTFRNCPNNCPLALWWGDPDASASSPLSRWYPLFPRKTYGKEAGWYDFSS